MQFVHTTYGVFVRLEAGATVAAGDTLEAVRAGKVVAALTIDRITPSEKAYPHGCAVCKIASGAPAGGDAVRKPK